MKWLKSLRQIATFAIKFSWAIVLCTLRLALFLLAAAPPYSLIGGCSSSFYYELAIGRIPIFLAFIPLLFIAIVYSFTYFVIENLPPWDFTYWRRITMGELALNISIVLASLGLVAGVML